MRKKTNHFISFKFPYCWLISAIWVILLFSQQILIAQTKASISDIEGLKRNYTVFLPNNYSDTLDFPLVIYLHGYGWTVEQDMNYTRLYELTDTAGYIIVYPSGTPYWNSGISDNPDLPTPNIDDVEFINTLIDTLSEQYSIDLYRVYACGYSNGGFMAYKLACQLSNRIAAIASVGGVMPNSLMGNCNPLRTMPVLEIHGTDDWWVPVNGTGYWHSVDKTLSYWTNYNNCTQIDRITLPDVNPEDSCTVEKIVYANSSNNCEVIYYKVINGGHTWPGAGKPGYSHEGNVNDDFNANIEILNFFKKYKLDR